MQISFDMEGKLIIISAPSGAGKTTIVKHILKAGLNLEFSISASSRTRRPEEVDGKDYYFMSVQSFKQKIEGNAFIEWEEVYKDHFYGTLKSEVQRIWESGNHVIFDVDVVGGLNIKKFYNDLALAIFIMPPSVEVLEERLRKRSTETEENLLIRLRKAKQEVAFAGKFDVVVVNNNLEKAIAEVTLNITSFLETNQI